jgi:hypothetical protein
MRVFVLTTDGRLFDEVCTETKDMLEFIQFVSEYNHIQSINVVRTTK